MILFSFADAASPTPPSGGSAGTGSPGSPGAPAGSAALQARREQGAQRPPGDPVSGQPLPEEEEKDDADVGKEVRAVLMNILPWGISFLLHVGLFILAIFIVWSTIKNLEAEQPIIPSVRLSENPGAQLTQTQQKIQQQSSAKRSLTKTQEQSTITNQKVKLDSRLIGVAGGSAGAKANPFGGNVGDAGPFGASFYGAGGNARHIAFLIDASGSLIDTLPFVIGELKRTVNDLTDAQTFTVIFFQAGKPIEVPRPGLKKADAKTKEFVLNWIDTKAGNVVPQGRTSPIEAIKLALRYKPQLLYILSDNVTGRAQYELSQAEVVAEVKKANAGGTKINTIQFLYKDPLESYGMQPTLELISKESGGVYKFVSADELGIQ
ncbi:MAG: hypothetical protein WD042_14460 [Phycisphaeraceae bacterium]